MIKVWQQGDAYISRSDNPPELVNAMSLWGFPANFDPTQLPTGMFMCVMDEFTKERIAKGLQKPLPISSEQRGMPPTPPPMRQIRDAHSIGGFFIPFVFTLMSTGVGFLLGWIARG